jgi:REP element-mobilizing transposase RayT
MWNLPPPPGFQGLREDLPLRVYVRHLPHWRQDGATYFVTFRLGDSLPQAKLREIRHLRATWLRQHPPPHADEALQQLSREIMQRVERWLDQGMGDCVLRQRDLAKIVLDGLHRFDGERYELDVYVAMPNHVHAVVRPFADDTDPLESILQCWKRCSATKINKRRTTQGSLWQEESFDRIIRDEEHLYRAIQYIGTNPDKAGLSRDDCPVWIRPAWVELGWKFAWMTQE